MNNIDPQQQSQKLIEENRRLKLAVEELSILNDIATAITSTQSLEQIVDLIVQKCVKHLKVEQGVVTLLDEKDQNNPFHTMVRKQDSMADVLPYRLDTQLAGWMLKHKQPLLINNFKEDERFKWLAGKELPLSSLLSVPMLLKGKMLGLVTVFNKQGNADFTTGDQRLLAIISAQSAQVIENARLYQEEQDYLRLQDEMRLANEIQTNLLPKLPPQIKGYEIAGKSIPAKDVGGDYFDFIQLEEDQTFFCLGDVSGKGMPAALLMSNLQATLRGQTHPEVACKDCVERSNTLMFKSTDPKKFATLFYGCINSKNHTLTYCNAGHDNPFLISKNSETVRLKKGGIVLGFVPSFFFEEETIEIKPGDILVIYSDGITEAMNEAEEEFGEPRLSEILIECKEMSANEIVEKILENVDKHVGDVPQMDDKTLVVLKRQDINP